MVKNLLIVRKTYKFRETVGRIIVKKIYIWTYKAPLSGLKNIYLTV